MDALAERLKKDFNDLKGRTFLDLDGAWVTDPSMRHVEGLTQLRVLRLGYARNVDDARLANVGELKNLRVLGLGRTGVTDAGLEHIRGLAQLESLDISGTAVDDAGLAQLKGLTHLQESGLPARGSATPGCGASRD